MLIPDHIRKCVAFIGLCMMDGTHLLKGTGFFLGRDAKGDEKPGTVVLVTARHVIDGIKAKGLDKVWLRLNRADGRSSWESTELSSWFVHPTDTSIDIAMTKLRVSAEFDHLVFPYSQSVDDTFLASGNMGLGDEVFVIGLFQHHHGNLRNIPIVRIGNIATLGEEKVITQLGEMDAFLIEARSSGGLSGSPVFVNFSLRTPDGVLHPRNPNEYLLGLVHGHFEPPPASAASEVTGRAEAEAIRVNTGIAIVVPFMKIAQVLAAYEAQGC